MLRAKSKKTPNSVDQKKIEELLRQTQLIVDNSSDAIIGETLDGIITSWNGGAERMFGYSAQEVVGKSVSCLLPRDMRGEVRELTDKVRAGEVIPDKDSVRVCKDGTKIDVAFSASPIKREDGAVIGVSSVARDISERKKLERRIKELYEVRGKFISIISHQLRTPLTAVNWNLEILLNGDFGKIDEAQRTFLRSTHHASKEITRRINNLITAMDIEEDRIRYEKTEVSLESICAGVVQEVLHQCEQRGITCTYVQPVDDTLPVDGDGEKIRIAVIALMRNAIAYTKDGGKITTTLHVKDGVARFEVADTGIGIPSAEQHAVYSRFFRASNASVMQPDAFGIELFITKKFIEQHHGRTGFVSKEGEGSTFWFEIPLQKE